MKLSTRLTLAMVGLVLFTTAVTGILAYRNLLGVAVSCSMKRLDQHVRLLASELEAVVRGARADVLGFAVDEMVIGSSGDLADRSNVFAAAERRRLESRFSPATFTSRRLNWKRRAEWSTHPVFRPRGLLRRCLHPMVGGLEL